MGEILIFTRIVIILILVASQPSYAETFSVGETQVGPLFSPEGPGVGRYRLGVGMQLEILPVRLVESEQQEIPEVAAAFRYGLPYNLTLDARFHGVVIKNDADVGVSWTLKFGNVYVAPSLRLGLRFGWMNSASFDTNSWGLVTRPGVAAGFSWRNLRFSISQEFILSHDQHIRIGDIQLRIPGNFDYEGIVVTAVVETITPQGKILYFGFGLQWTSNYDQAWIAFSDDHTSRAYFPRLMAGYVF